MKGRLIHQYRVDSLLGEGGMGTVYQATDMLLERPVAMKMLHTHLQSQTTFMERFRNEAMVLARLNHPNIATLYNFIQDGTDFFMAMEYVEGESLETIVRRAGGLPTAICAEIIRQALEGLSHAHRKGILHRDIKPANLMLTPDGVVKLMDFGIARVIGEQRITQANRVVGTLEYMAPELIKGQEPSIASDMYAMGVLLYELLSGKLPFASRTDYELMQSIIRDKPAPLRQLNGQIPKELEAIVQKALDKNPAKRFADVRELQRALQPFAAQAPALDPANLVPTAPATDVLDIQPKRKITPDSIKRGAGNSVKKLVTPSRVNLATQQAGNWLQANWQMALAGGLTLLAIVFFSLILLDTSTPTIKPTPSDSTIAQQTIPQQAANEPLDQTPDQSTQQTPTTVDQPTQYSPIDKTPSPSTPQKPTDDKPVTDKPKSSAPTRPQSRETGSSQPKSRTEIPAQTPTESGSGENPQPVQPVHNEPVAEPVNTRPARRSVTLGRVRVNLALTDNLSSAEAREGQSLRFRVTDAVTANGEVVIRAGATAYGVVTRVKQAGGLLQKKDQLEFRIQTVDAITGQQIPLRSATIGEESKGQAVVFRSGQTFEVRTSDGVVINF